MSKKEYISEMESKVGKKIAEMKREGAKHIHEKTEVMVGKYKVYIGGSAFIKQGDLENIDVVIPIECAPLPMLFGNRYEILCGYWEYEKDVRKKWPEFMASVLIYLQAGKKIFAYCWAGHGRVGTFLASLIAILESKEESPDPIYEARKRYCPKAVETVSQAKMIFALRGEKPLKRYRRRGSLVELDDRFEFEEK